MTKKSPIGEYLRQPEPPEWVKESAITPEVAKELESLGFEIPEWVRIIPYSPEAMKGAIYVCRAIAEGDPDSLPDNLVGVCAFCATRIEYRPTAPPGITKVCGECAEAKANEQ